MLVTFMGFIAIVVTLAIIAVVFCSDIGGASSDTSGGFKYYAKKTLMSKAEISFYDVLYKIYGDQYNIFAQVSLSQLIGVDKANEPSKKMVAKNKIRGKFVDFVICNKNDMTTLVVIELDDASHDEESRKERDSFVDEAMSSAGVKIVHVKWSKEYDLMQIKALVGL